MKALAALGILSLFGVSQASANIYDVNETFGVNSITGTITTNGATGAAFDTPLDITAWSLTLQDGNPLDTFTLNQHNSTQYLVGTDLSATASQLSFNFSDSAAGYLFFQDPTSGVNGPYVCFISGSADCFHAHSIAFDPTTGTDSPSNPYVTLSGTQVIGTVATTPEPSLMVPVLAGFAALICARRRTRREPGSKESRI
jgi:hypothetical protein